MSSKSKTAVVNKDGKEFHFSFDPQNDDPREGVTLTGIFEGETRLRPSAFTDEEIPYYDAEMSLIHRK